MGLLQHIEHQISALNDLILVNNDRVSGYTSALEHINDEDLQKIFKECIQQSQSNVAQLIEYIHTLGGSPSNGTSLSGKVFQTWSSLKARITRQDRFSLLGDCERGEDMAKTAYREALDDKELIWKDPVIVKILTKQEAQLKALHEKIKVLRDASQPVEK
ncbi:MAG TPA: PA2169 family four-helix-bundle protein [Mucilaginibacter sp.]